eukprot:PhF_6_TR33509/c0_g1_i1/m.48845
MLFSQFLLLLSLTSFGCVVSESVPNATVLITPSGPPTSPPLPPITQPPVWTGGKGARGGGHRFPNLVGLTPEQYTSVLTPEVCGRITGRRVRRTASIEACPALLRDECYREMTVKVQKSIKQYCDNSGTVKPGVSGAKALPQDKAPVGPSDDGSSSSSAGTYIFVLVAGVCAGGVAAFVYRRGSNAGQTSQA